MLKWHPDKWVNASEEEKKTAADKFKEASEAYSVLSDPDKKARYDRFGEAGLGGDGGGAGFGGFGDFNINDVLRDLFGGAFGGFSGFEGFGGFGGGQRSGQRRVVKGRDILTRVYLTLEEIATGVEKEVTIERNERCPDCGGKGTKNESDVQTCPVCNGSGQEQRVMNGFMYTYTTCSRCHGEGTVVKNPCRSCSGTGLAVTRSAFHNIRIALFKTECKCREAVCNKINPKQMNRLKQCEAEQGCKEYRQHLRQI